MAHTFEESQKQIYLHPQEEMVKCITDVCKLTLF